MNAAAQIRREEVEQYAWPVEQEAGGVGTDRATALAAPQTVSPISSGDPD